jgi:hypothetical protein
LGEERKKVEKRIANKFIRQVIRTSGKLHVYIKLKFEFIIRICVLYNRKNNLSGTPEGRAKESNSSASKYKLQ